MSCICRNDGGNSFNRPSFFISASTPVHWRKRAAAGAVHLGAQLLVGGAGAEAQSAVDAVEEQLVVDAGAGVGGRQRRARGAHAGIVAGGRLATLRRSVRQRSVTNRPGLKTRRGSNLSRTAFCSARSAGGRPQTGNDRFHSGGQRSRTTL